MSVVEFGLVERASGEMRMRHAPEDRNDVVKSHVGDGFGRGATRVAVDDSCALLQRKSCKQSH